MDKRLELTAKQQQAIELLKQAIAKCDELGVKFLQDEDAKDEEKNALNSLLEKMPGKQYDLEENECMIGVDCWLIDQLPDPDVAALNEQCKRILDKVSKTTEYDKEEMYVVMSHGENMQPLYSIIYDDGILEGADNMSYDDVQRYLKGIEFAVDMWIAED